MESSRKWKRLCNTHYDKRTVYSSMLWDPFTFPSYKTCAAPYGGPIAMILDEKQMAAFDGFGDGFENDLEEWEKEVVMRIFTAAGRKLSSFSWNYSGVGLVEMGWTSKENLVCVLEDGNVLMYSVYGKRIHSFLLGQKCTEDRVAACHIWDDGLVVRTGGVRPELYAVCGFDDPVPIKLSDVDMSRRPVSMTVIPPKFNRSGRPEVFLATQEGSIVVVDHKSSQDMMLENARGPFTKMVVSPNGKKVACYNENGVMNILSTDFTKNICKFSAAELTSSEPQHVVWCGNDAVALYYFDEDLLILVGFYAEFISYRYKNSCPPLCIISEVDSIRIITAMEAEIVMAVPPSTESIFKQDSTSSSSVLFRAFLAYDDKDVQADELMRSLTDPQELKRAIDECIDAALHEFKLPRQKQLLSAASFGKLFCDNYPADFFVEKAKLLRVLNALRHRTDVGVPLTFAQLEAIDVEVIIDRLVNRHEHMLAWRVCKYLAIPVNTVLVNWAICKILAADKEVSDESLARAILKKLLAEDVSISFRQVATAAYHQNRQQLATKLLEHEPLVCDQVPLLLKMGQSELALRKAAASGDTDLVYEVLTEILTTSEQKEYIPYLNDIPVARAIFIKYCKENAKSNSNSLGDVMNMSVLQDYYRITKQSTELGYSRVLESLRAKESEKWDTQAKMLTLAADDFSRNKNQLFLENLLKEELLLWRLEERLQPHYDVPVRGKSVGDILSLIVANTDPTNLKTSRAVECKNEFKVPEHRYWHTLVRVYAAKSDPELLQLQALARLSKKAPPIGFQPFIEACVDNNNLRVAETFILKLPDKLEQMEWLCNVGLWARAASIAMQENNMDAIQTIQAKCRDPAVLTALQKHLQTS
jgi:hypothetical protein